MTFGEGQENNGHSLGQQRLGQPRLGCGLRAVRSWAARAARGLIRLALPLALGVLVACTPLYANHGYIPEDRDLAALKTGVDTRESVAAFLGRPSAEGLLADSEWFYVQSRWKTVGGREPVEVDRQVVAITFDPAGKMSNVERFGLDKGQVVAISRRITTEPITGRSALAQIFANIGRIDPASLLKK